MADRTKVFRQAVAWIQAQHEQGARTAAEELADHFLRRNEMDSAAFWQEVAAAITEIRKAPTAISGALH